MKIIRKYKVVDGVDILSAAVIHVGDETDSYACDDRFNEEDSKIYVTVKQEVNFYERKSVKVLLGEKVPIYSQGPATVARDQGSLFPMSFKVNHSEFFWRHVDCKSSMYMEDFKNRNDLLLWCWNGMYRMPLEDIDYIEVDHRLYSLGAKQWTNVGDPRRSVNEKHQVDWFRDLKRIS